MISWIPAYKAFDSEIAARNGAPAVETLAGLTDARIVEAALVGKTAEITVSFRAQFARGETQRDVTDIWTFCRDTRAGDPNWLLVATSGDDV